MSNVVRAECYAGYRGEETPRRFYLEEKCIEIVSLIDSWLAPDYLYSKVEDDDGHRYVLRHDAETQYWELSHATAGKRN